MLGSFNLDRASVVRYIKSNLPDADWVLRYLESKGGWLQLPPALVSILEKGNIDNYVELYLDEQRLNVATTLAILGRDGLKEFGRDFEMATPEERTKFFNESLIEMSDVEFPSIPKTKKEIAAAKKVIDKLPEEERKEVIQRGQIFYAAFLAHFYNYLSVMVHGEKMTALVAQAIKGDDEAFVLAVQIDRTVLVGLPYFRDRLIKAQREGHKGFLDALGYRIANPVAKGKIRYRRLWFSFAILDGLGYLDGTRTHSELLNILDEAGLDTWENRIQDTGYFSKRLREYRKFQERVKIGRH